MQSKHFDATIENLTHGDRFRDVLSHVRYRDWQFRIHAMGRGRWYLQVVFGTANARGDAAEPEAVQYGRKWLLSEYMTDSEVIQTALKAVLTAEEHEAREHFLVEGVPVFGPHFDVMALAIMASGGLIPMSPRPMPPDSVVSP
jgi:hypothetical protein